MSGFDLRTAQDNKEAAAHIVTVDSNGWPGYNNTENPELNGGNTDNIWYKMLNGLFIQRTSIYFPGNNTDTYLDEWTLPGGAFLISGSSYRISALQEVQIFANSYGRIDSNGAIGGFSPMISADCRPNNAANSVKYKVKYESAHDEYRVLMLQAIGRWK